MFANRQSGLFRTAILVAAILALLGVSMASTSAAHIHLRSSGGSCDICVTAHVVSLEAHAIYEFMCAAPTPERFVPAGTSSGYQFLLTSSFSSRGPPALA